MNVDIVRIEGYHEALALHRFLFECKVEDVASTYAGSPFIAAIQHRLADALEAADPGAGWRKWRRAEQHTQRVEAVRYHLSTAGRWWNDMGREQRGAYVRDLLAPLRLPAELLAELTEVEGESAHAPNGSAGGGVDLD